LGLKAIKMYENLVIFPRSKAPKLFFVAHDFISVISGVTLHMLI